MNVGAHIIRGDITSSCCGFCGLTSCNVALVILSGKGKTASLAEESNCPFTVKFSLKAAKKC